MKMFGGGGGGFWFDVGAKHYQREKPNPKVM